jgi:hypothetical protein
LVSIDFFTVPTVRLRVLFVLVVLAHHRRRVRSAASSSTGLSSLFVENGSAHGVDRDNEAVVEPTGRRQAS